MRAARELERPRARPDLVFRQAQDGWILYDPRAQKLHVLNLTSALIWSHLDGRWNVDDIVNSLAESYGKAPPRKELRSHVEHAIRTFDRAELLR